MPQPAGLFLERSSLPRTAALHLMIWIPESRFRILILAELARAGVRARTPGSSLFNASVSRPNGLLSMGGTSVWHGDGLDARNIQENISSVFGKTEMSIVWDSIVRLHLVRANARTGLPTISYEIVAFPLKLTGLHPWII